MPPSQSSRKRQQRLAFTPLPSSSPAAKGLNKQIQDRAAAVVLAGSPSPAKRRKLGGNENVRHDAADPSASLELVPDDSHAKDSGSDSEPVRSTQRRRDNAPFTRPQQKRLNFDNARDPSSFDSPIRLSSSASTRASTKAGMFSSQARRKAGAQASEGSGSESEILPTSRATMSQSKRSRRKAQAQEQEQAGPDSEEIVVENGRSQVQGQDGSSDEDDDMPTTQGTQRRRKRAARRNSFVSVSPPPVSDSDDVVIMSTKKRKRTKRGKEDDEEDEDDEEQREQLDTPASRRLKRPRKMTKEEQEDLADDLDFLKPSDDDEEAAGRTPRNTQSTKKNARMDALEKLKRKRAGQEVAGKQDNIVDLLSDSEKFNSDEDDGLLDEDEAPAYTSSRAFFQENEEDAEFVEEADEEDALGVPAGIPLEFTRYASMKTKELFKYAVEWMVQRKINPGFKMNDPIYNLTFKKLDDEVTGLASSKFKSSVWRKEFTIALESRPEILFHRLDQSGDNWLRDKCDACGRTNHPCKYEVQFRGRPYNRHTLEDVDADDDDDDDDDEEDSSDSDEEASTTSSTKEAINQNGQSVVPTSHIFYVGKFCMSNAETAHKLNHWRYHLNEWVENFLAREKYLTPEEIVRRDGLKTKKRGKEANRIVDRMERDGRVKELWQEYKSAMEVARSAKMGRYGGDSP
ncbi:hypothetical protein TI39_contig4243g00009 [Zymoseptoria brevis]|uniref:DUF4211 domain-containing protein n=1 Tax=Zymoseptoria brevis TaxID=1047168 RepID=A0A0F4G971_9PEZI|nr:hypothetical protein TI39_contig4243g00009 [Zymoseptoria brevis]